MIQSAVCPKCGGAEHARSGIVKGRQRYRCKACSYHFTVYKEGKSIDNYYVIKSLQLYIEGLSYREIERILGVSHVSVMNWVKRYGLSRPVNLDYKPTYKVVSHPELVALLADRGKIRSSALLITELGDKYMVIQWEKYRMH